MSDRKKSTPEDYLKAYLRKMVRVGPMLLSAQATDPFKGCVYRGFMDLVLRHGRGFEPQPLPKGYRRRRARACFDNAWLLASRSDEASPQLRYAEGFALPSNSPAPVHHAWCVDHAGRVVDPTWSQPGLVYFGVLIPIDQVSDSMVRQQAKTGAHGSVLDDWWNDWALLRAPFRVPQR